MHGEDRQVARDEVDVLLLLLDVRVAAAVVEKVILLDVFALRMNAGHDDGRGDLEFVVHAVHGEGIHMVRQKAVVVDPHTHHVLAEFTRLNLRHELVVRLVVVVLLLPRLQHVGLLLTASQMSYVVHLLVRDDHAGQLGAVAGKRSVNSQEELVTCVTSHDVGGM